MSARPPKLLVIALAVWAALVGLTGTAAAYFTAGGSGTGAATSTTILPVTAVAGAANGNLHPGGTADAVLQITNPNDFAVTVVEILPAGSASATGGIGSCTTTGVSFVAPAVEVLEALDPIEPGEPTVLTLADAVSMSAASESGCQGADFDIPITVAVVR